jgi:hypothetical protein
VEVNGKKLVGTHAKEFKKRGKLGKRQKEGWSEQDIV